MNSAFIETLEILEKAKAEKKKKEPSKAERDEFCTAWIKLASSEGYTDRAEKYIYSFSSYCGAKPFKLYLDRCENKFEVMQKFFAGKKYGANCDVTFRLLIHLLALLLNDRKSWMVLPVVLKRLPKACLNKDKKRLGTINQTIIKYFFAKLDPGVQLPPLSSIDLKPVFLKEFVDVLGSIIRDISIDGLSKNQIISIEKVSTWLTTVDKVDKADQEAAETESQEECSHTNLPIQDEKAPAPSETADSSKQEEETLPPEVVVADNIGEHIGNLLAQASKEVGALYSKLVSESKKVEEIANLLKQEEARSLQAMQQIEALNEQINVLRKNAVQNEATIVALRREIADKNDIIAAKDSELADRVRMAEALSRDRMKQADEALQRMASKVRVEYRDYADAVEMPMTCDLGENLRLQLQSVFDILEKGGMKFK